VAQHVARRPGGVGQMVWHIIEVSLNPVRSLQAAELAQLRATEARVIVVHGLTAVYPEYLKFTIADQISNLLPTEQLANFRRLVDGRVGRRFTQGMRGKAIGYSAGPHSRVAAGQYIHR